MRQARTKLSLSDKKKSERTIGGEDVEQVKKDV